MLKLANITKTYLHNNHPLPLVPQSHRHTSPIAER